MQALAMVDSLKASFNLKYILKTKFQMSVIFLLGYFKEKRYINKCIIIKIDTFAHEIMLKYNYDASLILPC